MPETMASLSRALGVYVNATVAYGFTRAVTYDYTGVKKYFNAKTGRTEVKEMLLVDKVGSVCTNSFAAIVAWPFMVTQDLTRLECALKRKDPSEYE